jgi:beta-N-acetylhexosaminidase
LLPPAPDAQFQAVVDAVRSGRISERRIDESVLRILLLKLTKGVLTQPFVDPARIATTVGTPASLATAQRIVDKSVTLVKKRRGRAAAQHRTRARCWSPAGESPRPRRWRAV